MQKSAKNLGREVWKKSSDGLKTERYALTIGTNSAKNYVEK